jgi:hypothetical protein
MAFSCSSSNWFFFQAIRLEGCELTFCAVVAGAFDAIIATMLSNLTEIAARVSLTSTWPKPMQIHLAQLCSVTHNQS